MTDLRRSATSGIIWSAVERFGQQGCAFFVQLLLARLLAPEQFGLIAMVAVFVTISNVCVDAGFGQALIQRKEVGDLELSTVFYFTLMIACLMAGLLCVIAPWIADFYQIHELTLILRVLSVGLVIGAFGSVHATVLARKMQFKRLFWVSLPATLVSGGIAISLALNGLGVWALVVQVLCSRVLTASLLWFASAWKPRVVFSFSCLRDMFPYGSRLALSALLNQGFESIYILVIGKVFSAVELGNFQRARSFQRFPVQNIQYILGRVAFPLFSSIQDDPIRMKRGMRIAIQLGALFAFPIMALLSSVSQPMVATLIGEKWLPCVPYLRWLCLVGALFPLHAMNLSLLTAIGRSDLFLRLAVIKKIFVVINLVVLYFLGVQCMIYGMGVASICALLINTYYTNKFINYSFLSQVRDVFYIIAIALIIMGANIAFLYAVPLSAPAALISGCSIAAIVFLLSLRFVGESLKAELRRVLDPLPLGVIIGRMIL
jgi:teichuronic acid exporter